MSGSPTPTPTSVRGFVFGGISAGIKKRGGPDFGLILAEAPVPCAGVFTTNVVVAAPVVQSRAKLASGARARAVLVNSGNANACSGARGEADAAEMARLAAEAIGCAPRDIQVCSTGVIGAPMPMERVQDGLPRLVDSAREDGLPDFARAIMTTDTRPKQRGLWLDLEGRRIAVAGACKGAGMIHPNMATMLGFVLTDAPVDEADLVAVWGRVAGRSFNAISVDGDTSTNDTALCLASGAAGGPPLKGAELAAFERALAEVAGELARDIVRDAEGATKVVAVTVSGAPTEADARRAADAIATSPLVKTALHGEDPNWGRMVAAVGRSGCPIDTARVRVEVGGVVVFQANAWAGAEAEKAAHAVMCTPEYGVSLDLGLGDAQFTIFTCDLSADYVRINADYRS